MELQSNENLSNVVGLCRQKPAQHRCHSCILDISDYFAHLPVVAKSALQQRLQWVTFERRQYLYREKQAMDHLYILISGEVKVYKSLADGRQQIHKLTTIPGDLIACEDVFLDTHSSTAETIVPTVVGRLTAVDMTRLMKEHRPIADTLMRSMARNLNSYIKHIANLGQKKALERVASYLVFLSETHGERNLRSEVLTQSLTRTELADVLGITQRTLIRSLKQLESDGIVSLARGGFIILDPAALVRVGGG